jgi:hypothetical protein
MHAALDTQLPHFRYTFHFAVSQFYPFVKMKGPSALFFGHLFLAQCKLRPNFLSIGAAMQGGKTGLPDISI